MKFVSQLLSAHLARYPAMQLDDVYKLLHQAALGPGHAVANPVAARKRLDEEIAALGEESAELLQDVISPDGRLGRVHLRPYLASGGDRDALHRAFVETANSYPASPDKLAKFCGCLGDLAAAGGIPFAREEVVTYFGKIASDGYPAIHHSEAFRNAYRPAYRVVAIDLLQK
ncbi:MAG: hypothetical protein ABI648_02585 [Betaproteobacteria bacterium]|jgi:hypothetical protein